MKSPIVINLIGGPGVGKSTIASGIFYRLKKVGVNCELALEFAKDKVYEESFKTIDDQIYIFAKQYHRLWRLKDKVDVIITDSPLLVSMHYMKEKSKYFNDFVVEQYKKFDNLLYFIERGNDVYHPEGRMQTEEEAKRIDTDMKNVLSAFANNEDIIEYKCIERFEAVDTIVSEVLALLSKKDSQVTLGPIETEDDYEALEREVNAIISKNDKEEAFVTRMKTEYKELDEKIGKLSDFFKGEIYKSLPNEEQEDMVIQYHAMISYLVALGARLKRKGVNIAKGDI